MNFGGAQSFARLSQINQELGTLRANGGDENRIAALEAERTQLLAIDGVASSDGLMNARSGLIDGLSTLSIGVYHDYWNWIGIKENGITDPEHLKLPVDQAAAAYQQAVSQAESKYLVTLGQSPFLSAMVDPANSGDPVPFWKYLTSRDRSPDLDQAALTQAIEFLDQGTAQVIDQFGTIVTTQPLLEAYGSPVFTPLRLQVVSQLSPIYPGLSAHMGLLTSQYDAHAASTAFARAAGDVTIGFVQIVVAGVIFVFPITAPVLVPIEIGLTAGQVGLEGFRTYYAWQDLQRAQQAAAAGGGASQLGVKPYADLFDAQAGTFALVGALAPISVTGSVLSLNAANAQLRLAANLDSPNIGAVLDASTLADSTIAGGSRAAPEVAAFNAMRPNDQVAAVTGLPENLRNELVGQLGVVEKELFAIAWEQNILNARMIASVRQGNVWLEWINGELRPLTDATRNATDQQILDRLSPYAATRDQLVLSREAMARFYDDVGDDVIGPFSTAKPLSKYEGAGEGTFPVAGQYTGHMTRAEIDALIAKPGPLTPEETALKADLLLRGFGREEAATGSAAATPITLPPNPFTASSGPFGPAGAIDAESGTIVGAGDSLSGATERIPGRGDPNRTALYIDPDLPPETIILDPFIPPAAGLLEFPFDFGRLIQGDPLPINIWTTRPSTVVGGRRR